MLRRHLCLARAWSAAGLLTCTILGASAALAEPDDPSPAAGPDTRTVDVLSAKKAGDLGVELRGQGQDRVRLVLKNTTSRRLNVVLPAGLVAASATGQPGGGAGGGGGFQSMGLGTPTNEAGAFGAFRDPIADTGFRSIPPAADRADAPGAAVTVPVGQTVDVSIPAVCLNFGMPTPTARDRFVLMDVSDYSPDPRVRKALRSLATLGTSHGVAQAAMWRVCNDVPFEFMAAQHSKIVNPHEIALAARFVAAVDASGDAELVDPAYLAESRILVDVRGDGPLAREARRIADSMEGLRLMGLPVRVVGDDQDAPPQAAAPAILVRVLLTGSNTGETRGRVLLERAAFDGGDWVTLGKTTFSEGSSAQVLDAPTLLKSLDHAIAAAFVTVKPARHGTGSTTLKIDNHLPFTLANVVVKAGGSSGRPKVDLKGLGVGPARSALAPIQAPGGSVDHIELNGL